MTMPAPARGRSETLNQNGHAAYLVGRARQPARRGAARLRYHHVRAARRGRRRFPRQDADRVPASSTARQTLHSGGMNLEITTYRTDGALKIIVIRRRSPSRARWLRISHAEILINAMAYHPARGLVDLFGGQADLAAGVVRCVGAPARPLTRTPRMLRAPCASPRCRFRDRNGHRRGAACQKDLLTAVSAERIREELMRLLCGRDAACVLDTYLPVFSVFLPELSPMQGFERRNPHHVYDVWHTHWRQSMPSRRAPPPAGGGG